MEPEIVKSAWDIVIYGAGVVALFTLVTFVIMKWQSLVFLRLHNERRRNEKESEFYEELGY